jgi:di/tricarboxylate transporter
MPWSFAASLGTTITMIGAPALLIASHVWQQAGRPGLGIFSIAPIGLSLSLAGTACMRLAGRVLLPTRTGVADPTQRFRLTASFPEVTMWPNSPLLDKTAAEVEPAEGDQVAIVTWLAPLLWSQ